MLMYESKIKIKMVCLLVIISFLCLCYYSYIILSLSYAIYNPQLNSYVACVLQVSDKS